MCEKILFIILLLCETTCTGTATKNEAANGDTIKEEAKPEATNGAIKANTKRSHSNREAEYNWRGLSNNEINVTAEAQHPTTQRTRR